MLKKIITEDGSISFYNTEIEESYHSKSGALEEALKKHVEPSNIKTKKDFTIIGDLFFGLGYNTIVAIKTFLENNPEGIIQVFAFENDLSIIQKLNEIKLPEEYEPYKNIIIELIDEKNKRLQKEDYDLFVYESEQIIISLYLGDIKKTLSLISDESFEIVFFDPFSPKKQGLFWSETFLEEVYRVMDKNSVLTTYSCAKKVRENMTRVGFKIFDGPIIGRKSPGTIARKD